MQVCEDGTTSLYALFNYLYMISKMIDVGHTTKIAYETCFTRARFMELNGCAGRDIEEDYNNRKVNDGCK